MLGHGLAAPTLYACAVIAFLLSIFWRREGVTLYIPLLAALETPLYRYSGSHIYTIFIVAI